MNNENHGAAGIAGAIKNRIMAGKVRQGEYLSSIRSLSQEFGCAPLTAHRALKQLAETGLVVAEPRHGYRVMHRAPVEKTAAGAHEVVVFLEETKDYERNLGEIYETQLSILRRGTTARGWISAVLPYDGQPAATIEKQLREMGATALILQDIGNRFPPDLTHALQALRLPTVSLDLSAPGPTMDCVLRDEHHGAMLATQYLIRKGHRRIGWYGPLTATGNARRRFSGAAEALLMAGISIDGQGWRETDPAIETVVAREFLQRPGRPPAVLALWQTAARALIRAARDLGLKIGKDVDVVGWSLEEHFARSYIADCPELRESCATVTWSMADVGRSVLHRIEERRREPDLPGARILLPMRLREPGK